MACLRIHTLVALAAWTLAAAAPAHSIPDLGTRRIANEMVVFADDTRADLFWYAPLELTLVTAPDGKPDFRYLEMRYAGNARSGDRGLILHRTLLTVRVALPSWSAEARARWSRALGNGGRTVELRPLPLRRIEAALVYASLGGAADTTELKGGRFEASRDAEGPAGEGYWNERVFTVALDSLTAQVMRSALVNGQLALSLGYAFVADGRIAAEPWGDVAGSLALTQALRDGLAASANATAASGDSMLRRVVAAGAIPVHVDARRWPELFQRVDVDGSSPIGFAMLDVYCYDFHDNRRPDLYEKVIEVEAQSANGKPVRLQVVFARAHPDVYSASLRFPAAVRLDRPYRYRVAELRPDGSSTQGGWRTGRDWVGMLDLTAPALPSSQGVRPIR